MVAMKLIIGNKNYSSWSLRGWLMLKAFEIPFEETLLPLFSEQFYAVLKDYTPVGKVPVLVDQDVSVWDSLAICEYLNETYLHGKAWPSDAQHRAVARAMVCEMHSGFSALRSEMPMNCRAHRSISLSESAQQDVARIDQLWARCLTRYAGGKPWLFGEFSIADVFFAPIVFRFKTYGISLSTESTAYQKRLLAHPAMQLWLAEALKETAIVPEDEAGEER
ncbi:MAG: glutathione S-transferase [Neptuniibacter pectenicola]|jgi:glutathione S-transferase